MIPIVLFWGSVVLGVANVVSAGWNTFTAARRQRAGLPWRQHVVLGAFAGFAVAIAFSSAAMMWRLMGPCVLPHPAVIPFEAWAGGTLTLCPGQSIPIEIVIPADLADHTI